MGKNNEVKSFHGTVQWFDAKLGYGFIESPSFDKAVFAHHTRIISNEPYKTLSKGQLVAFEMTNSVKGYMAVNIREEKIIPANAKVVS